MLRREVAVWIQNLQSDDGRSRILASKQISAVAQFLGPDRALHELFPFLEDLQEYDEDILSEVLKQLLVVMTQMPLLTDKICIFAEQQFVHDSSSVRKLSLDILVQACRSSLATNSGLFHRMAACDSLEGKILSCEIAPYILSRSFDPSIYSCLTAFAQQDIGNVRRSAYLALSQLTGSVPVGLREGHTRILRGVLEDPDESVRLVCVKVVILSFADINDCKSILFDEALAALCKDPSSRVRIAFYDSLFHSNDRVNVCEIKKAVTAALKDSDELIRFNLADNLSNLLTSRGLEACFLQALEQLSEDISESVRCKAASSLSQSDSQLLKCVATEILPILLKLLRDPSFRVRSAVLAALGNSAWVSEDIFVFSAMPAIEELSKSTDWRIRVKLILSLTEVFHTHMYPESSDKLAIWMESWLKDPNYSVRECAATCFKDFAIIFGSEWLEITGYSILESCTMSENYLHRISGLSALSHYAVHNLGNCPDKFQTLLARCASDIVPNIRLLALQIFNRLAHGTAGVELKHKIFELISDPDGDVSCLAKTSLETQIS